MSRRNFEIEMGNKVFVTKTRELSIRAVLKRCWKELLGLLVCLYHSTPEAYYDRKEEKMRIADYSVTKAVLERHGFTVKNPSDKTF